MIAGRLPQIRRALAIALGSSLLVLAIACARAAQPAFELVPGAQLIASDESSGSIVVRVNGSAGDAPVRATLYAGNHAYEAAVAGTPREMTLRFAVPTAGPATLRFEAAGVSRTFPLVIAPAPPARVRLDVDVASEPPSLRRGLRVAVMDAFDNVVPRAPNELEIVAEGSVVANVRAGDRGVVLADLAAPGPRQTTLVVRDRASGLASELPVLFAEIALRGPSYLIIEPGRQGEFPVDVYVFLNQSEKLRGLRLRLATNDRARFAKVDSDRTGPVAVNASLDGEAAELTVERLETAFDPGGQGLFLARIWLTCLGEGLAEVLVQDASFTVDQARGRDRGGQPELWERQGCQQKQQGHELCVHPIVIGNSWSAAEIIRQLQILQQNLDQACCTISVTLDGTPLANVDPRRYQPTRIRGYNHIGKNGVLMNDAGGVVPVVGPGGKPLALTKDTEALLRNNRAARRDDCFNAYFAQTIDGWIDDSGRPRPGSTGATLTKLKIPKTIWNGSYAPERYSDKDGRPMVPRAQRPTTPGASDLALEDVMSVWTARDGIGRETFKHEMGHAFGLQHPAEYQDGVSLKKGDNRVMDTNRERGSYQFTILECAVIMQDINRLLKRR